MPVEDDDDRAGFLDPDEFGVEARYTAAGGSPIDLNVRFDEPSREILGIGEVPTIAREARAICLQSALPDGADQDDRLELVASGRVFRVKAIHPDSLGMVRLDLEGRPPRVLP